MKKATPLSASEFLRVAEFIKAASGRALLEDNSLDIVRSVVVEGRRQSDVAKHADVTRQWVHQALQKFWKAHAMYEQHTVPSGWKTERVALPEGAWPVVRQMEAQARAALKSNGA